MDAGTAARGSVRHSRDIVRLRAAIVGLAERGCLEEALATLKEALQIAPDDAELWLSGGLLALELGALGESLAYCEEALRLDRRSLQAAECARRISVAGGLPEEVLRYTDLREKLQPSPETLLARRLFLPAILRSVPAIGALRRQYEAGLDEALAAAEPWHDPYNLQLPAFYLAYHGRNDRDLQRKAAQLYLRRIPELAFVAPHCAARIRRTGRIRIGFISRFLWAHSIGKTSLGLIERLSRERFEVYVLRITPSREDAVTQLICASADRVVVLDPLVPRAREQIAALELDILFYQDIGLEPTSFFLAFARLARVQCVSFGHPNTTGIPNLDYFISNDLYETEDARAHYSERLFLLRDLPTLAYYYRPVLAPGSAPDRSKFALPEAATIYLCPQTLFKIHPDLDAPARRILQRDPRGVLVFIRGQFDQWTQALLERFAATMPDVVDRIRFLPTLGLNDFLELLSVVDVVLDPIHFNGMNSSLESLAMGTPVVTLPTALQRGRHTQAMYRKMGILDCVASSVEDYADIAVRLANDPGYAADVRRRIRERSAALFEDARVVEEFERFFLDSLAVGVSLEV